MDLDLVAVLFSSLILLDQQFWLNISDTLRIPFILPRALPIYSVGQLVKSLRFAGAGPIIGKGWGSK
jgi:hypothetical protein